MFGSCSRGKERSKSKFEVQKFVLKGSGEFIFNLESRSVSTDGRLAPGIKEDGACSMGNAGHFVPGVCSQFLLPATNETSF